MMDKLFLLLTLTLVEYFVESYSAVRHLENESRQILSSEHTRVRRKVAVFDTPSNRKWNTTIQYYFTSPDFTLLEKSIIRSVLRDDFEKTTCLRFTEQTTRPYGPFIGFHSDAPLRTCEASTGVDADIGQEDLEHIISLHKTCFTVRGYVIHAVARTLGLYGEVLRPDRDQYVDVLLDNVLPALRPQYNVMPDELSENYEVPYDYGSITHVDAKRYGYPQGSGHRLNASFPVLPKDPRYVRSLGQRSELSFYDIQAINRAYCSPQPEDGACQLQCKHGGYADTTCQPCVCPDGMAGITCEEIYSGSEGCNPSSGVIEIVAKETNCLESPNYNWPTSGYTAGDRCSWLLRAPEGHRVQAWFSHNLYLPSPHVGYTPCWHWVEIKFSGVDQVRGPRYCNSDNSRSAPEFPELEPPWTNTPVVSTGNEMMVLFNAPDFNTGHPRTNSLPFPLVGFRLCYNTTERTEVVPKQQIGSRDDSKPWFIYLIPLLFALVVIIAITIVVCYKLKSKKASGDNSDQHVNAVYYIPENPTNQISTDASAIDALKTEVVYEEISCKDEISIYDNQGAEKAKLSQCALVEQQSCTHTEHNKADQPPAYETLDFDSDRQKHAKYL